jgi:hypothetical protein
MSRGLARLALLAASLALAEEAPPTAPKVTVQETPLATVVSESVEAKRFVADHAEALAIHLRNAAAIGAPPSAKPRIEVADVAGLDDVAVGISGGHALVAVRLGSPADAPLRAGEAAARAWLAAASVAGGRPTNRPAPWAPAALAAESVAQLRPAMLDLWYRRAAAGAPATLRDLAAGKAPAHEALLLGRALRRSLGAEGLGAALAGAARGEPLEPVLARLDADPAAWWLGARQQLLDARPPVSLGMAESLAALDALARFVHDPDGKGDRVLAAAEAARLRALPGIRDGMAGRLAALRRDILRQNPVAHNAWRSLGAWLEAFPSAEPAELERLWAGYLLDRQAADRLAAEVDAALGDAR